MAKKMTTAKYRSIAWDAQNKGNYATAAKNYDLALKNYPKHHPGSQLAAVDKAGLTKLRDQNRRAAKEKAKGKL